MNKFEREVVNIMEAKYKKLPNREKKITLLRLVEYLDWKGED